MSFRPAQIGKEILKAMSLLLHEELPFERFGLVTITEVVMTPGLEHAKIFVSAFQHPEQAVETLNKRAGWFARILSKSIRMKKFPLLTFHQDMAVEKAERIERLLEGGDPLQKE